MAVPSDYAGLELWLKGDVGVYQDDAATTPATANGDPIAVWQDQSGNARHATQTTSGNRPTLDVSVGLGGKNVVNLAAANRQFFNLPNFLTGFTAGEIWVVLKRAADPPAGGSPNGGFWRLGSGVDNDHYPWTDSNVYLGAGSTVRKTVGNPTPSLAVWHMLRIYSASGAYRVWSTADDLLLYDSTTNTVGWTTVPTLGKSIGDYHWDGKIAELFLYSQARSDAERTALQEYITTRYFNPVYRDSQVFAETALAPTDPPLRDSQVFPEIALAPDDPPFRDTQVWAEVALTSPSDVRNTLTKLDVGQTGDVVRNTLTRLDVGGASDLVRNTLTLFDVGVASDLVRTTHITFDIGFVTSRRKARAYIIS